MAQLCAVNVGTSQALYLVENAAFTVIAPWSSSAGQGGRKETFGARLAGGSGVHPLKVFGQPQVQEAEADKMIFLYVFSRTTGSSASRTRHHKHDPSRKKAADFLTTHFTAEVLPSQ